MDPFERRAQIFAKEFKLGDSKFFVNALEATMRVAHFEASKWEPRKSPDIKRRNVDNLTGDRLKRFRGIVEDMQNSHNRLTLWSYQKSGNLLRIAQLLIQEIENLWSDIAVWKAQVENRSSGLNYYKEENELLKRVFKAVEENNTYPGSRGASCRFCTAIRSDRITAFKHDADCAYLKVLRLL